MQTEVLRVLRAEARSWWRHRELKRNDGLDEARRPERQTISRDIGYLRVALNNPNAYVSCGGGGTILHLGLTTVSLHAPVERFLLASLAVRLGTPLIGTSLPSQTCPRSQWTVTSLQNLGRPPAVYRS